MFTLGLSTPRFSDEALFKEYSEAGILNMEVSFGNEYCEKLDFDELKRLSEKYGVNLYSFHLPFYPFNKIDISNKELADYSVKYLSSLIKKGSDIGIHLYIIHASGEPIDENQRKERMECAKSSLKELCQVAKENGSIIAVENLPRTCLGRNSSDIKELLSADSSLVVCYDTNHLLGQDAIEFIKDVGDKIATTHISDYDFKDERHWLPGEGKNNWQAIIKALLDVGYNGIWLYEIDFQCPWTIHRDRDLNCHDFVRNADEVLNNKKITIFSTPNENL